MPSKPPHNSITPRQHHLTARIEFFPVLMYWHVFFFLLIWNISDYWMSSQSLTLRALLPSVQINGCAFYLLSGVFFPVLLACYTPNTLSFWYKATAWPRPRETVKLMAFLWLQHNTWFTACTKFSVWKIRLRFTLELVSGIPCARLCRNRWQI